MEQILLSSSPSPYKPTPTSSRGFVCWQEQGIDLNLCPFHRIVLWLLPSPLYLTHWSSVLYFFFKMIVCFLLFLQVLWKKKKTNVRKFKYLKMFQGNKRGFCYYSNILLCTYCKYETLLFCKPRTHFVLLLYINKVYWLKKPSWVAPYFPTRAGTCCVRNIYLLNPRSKKWTSGNPRRVWI